MSTASKTTTSKKAADAAHDAVDNAAARAEEFEALLREKAEELMESAGDGFQTARARTDDVSEIVTDYIDKKPMAALGIAFVAGLAISSLLRK